MLLLSLLLLLLLMVNGIFAQDTNTAFATGTHKIEHFPNKTLLKGGTVLERDIIDIFTLLFLASSIDQTCEEPQVDIISLVIRMQFWHNLIQSQVQLEYLP